MRGKWIASTPDEVARAAADRALEEAAECIEDLDSLQVRDEFRVPVGYRAELIRKLKSTNAEDD